jgi:hypothetical protein
LFAGAQQRTQLLDILFRNEARLDQSAGQKVGNPHRIVQISLAARNVLDVRRIGDDQDEVAVAQNLPHRHPIDAGGLHRHVAAATFHQPRQQSPQTIRRRVECPALPRHLAASRKAHAGDNRRLVHIKTGNPLVHYLHRVSLHSCAASVGSQNKRNLGSVLQDIAARGASVGHQGTPGPTRNRALTHQGDIDLLADGEL